VVAVRLMCEKGHTYSRRDLSVLRSKSLLPTEEIDRPITVLNPQPETRAERVFHLVERARGTAVPLRTLFGGNSRP
jgi:hypothetical protein